MSTRLRLLLATLLLFALPLLADTTYTYTGTDYTSITGIPYTSSMSVNGSFDLSSPLLCLTTCTFTPVSYSFSDGINTLSSPYSPGTYNSLTGTFQAQTDALGNIIAWNIQLNADLNTGAFETITTTTTGDSATFDVHGVNFHGTASTTSPGSWTPVFAAVPEPSTLALLGFGATLLGIRRRVTGPR